MQRLVRWRWAVLLAVVLLLAALPAAAKAADPARGEALYVGAIPFEAGGAPCLACHGVGGAGLGKAAGANYGPDLTAMWDDFGEDGVVDILSSLDIFPSMEALYVDRPLSAAEKADLAAFLEKVSGSESPKIAASILAEIGVGIGVVFLVLAIFGRNRFKGQRLSSSERE